MCAKKGPFCSQLWESANFYFFSLINSNYGCLTTCKKSEQNINYCRSLFPTFCEFPAELLTKNIYRLPLKICTFVQNYATCDAMEAFILKMHIFFIFFFEFFFRVIFSKKNLKMDKNGHKMGKNDLIEKNFHIITETTYMNVVLKFYVIWS